ncbi:hypothetical protein [Paractinoplanes durhamensis]|uniref:Class I SAM-dependent methyltransferase n=1 Tax=Paractinoplanes durhamensis TaxID=113563 RepID=A0ABQ3Z1M3_9ACTN|nr:hypothetical protein [Actinoplanes durhamensis]GIE03722.1 hypothetical protein Adu01nite_50720 [Actinoplanes durhamensis]
MSDTAALVPTQGTDYAAALAVPPVSNLRRIGGEMFAWSDSDPSRGPDRPRSALLRHLTGQFAGRGRSVLIAGPHADDLVAALVDGGATVSWLVRSLGDAENAAREHPKVTVLAGVLPRLDPEQRFDLVVAADGVERLNSVEGEQMSAGELLDRLAEAVRPDGVLLLTYDNHLGVHHTVRLDPGGREATDAAWYSIDDHDPHRPASAEQLTDRLTAAGLVVDVTYAAFPEPSAPSVLVGPGLLGNVDSPLRPRLGTALGQAFTAGFRGRAVLSDPRRLINRALRAGAESTVAPAWLIIARAPGVSAVPPIEGREFLAGDVRGTFVYTVGESTTVLEPLAEPVERDGLRRIAEPEAPGADTGYVLEERLLHLCATADLGELRSELDRYETWLQEQATDGTLSGPVALAGFADVFVTPQGVTLLPTRWAPIEPVPLETVLVRAIWEFGVQLITSAQPHPWPISSSAVDLTATMLGMVGRGIAETEIRAAVDLFVQREAAEFELGLAEQQALRLRLLAVTPGTAPVDIEGFRELSEALWRQRYQASHLLALMEWTEQIIQSRDKQLSKMDREIQFYRSKLAGKAMLMAREAYRVVGRDGRKFLRGRRKGS